MNLFKIDFLEKLKTLLKEAFKFKKYKAMPPAVAVFVGITFIPFVISSLMLAGTFAVLAFIFKIISYPFEFLRGLTNNEGREVKHATQFIIYFISWPLIFFGYVMISFILVAIAVIYALLTINTYIWSLGGFKFHVLITKAENIEITVNREYEPGTYIGYLAAWYGLLLIFIIVDLVVTLQYNNSNPYFFYPHGMLVFLPYGLSIIELFTILYTFIGFGPRPKEGIIYY